METGLNDQCATFSWTLAFAEIKENFDSIVPSVASSESQISPETSRSSDYAALCFLQHTPSFPLAVGGATIK